MDNHVIDHDVVVGRAKQRGEFQVEVGGEVAAFKVVKVAKLHIAL